MISRPRIRLTATLGGERLPCEMPLGKEDQIRAYGICGVKATDLCGKPATECAWCSDDGDGHLLCRECQIAVCGDYSGNDSIIAILTEFCVEEGMSLPGLKELPHATYWFLPALVGTPLIIRALVGHGMRYRRPAARLARPDIP